MTWFSLTFLLFALVYVWDGIAHSVKRALRAALRAFRMRPQAVES